MARRKQPPDPWAGAISRAVQTGVPGDAVAFYSRWWQLESWLRELVYLELRGLSGILWEDHIRQRAADLSAQEALNAYMASPDADNLLAFLDFGSLLKLLESEEKWALWQHAMPRRRTWLGVADQLRELRNRNAHCRRPHSDDLRRLEQALRDLEIGAQRTIASYNRVVSPDPSIQDPVVAAWVRKEHQEAIRLVDHADRNYQIEFALRYSRRPWAETMGSSVSGTPGYLWKASWIMRDGRFLSPRDFWRNTRLDIDGRRRLIVHVMQDHESAVEVTFAAVDPPEQIIDAVRACFDTVIDSSLSRVPEARRASWATEARGLDPRVQVQTPISLMTDDTPFSVFQAG